MEEKQYQQVICQLISPPLVTSVFTNTQPVAHTWLEHMSVRQVPTCATSATLTEVTAGPTVYDVRRCATRAAPTACCTPYIEILFFTFSLVVPVQPDETRRSGTVLEHIHTPSYWNVLSYLVNSRRLPSDKTWRKNYCKKTVPSSGCVRYPARQATTVTRKMI